MSPVVFAGAAAVPVSLPDITGVVSSAVFAGGGGGGAGVIADTTSPVDEGTVTVGVTDPNECWERISSLC